jgi:hypothetical protein
VKTNREMAILWNEIGRENLDTPKVLPQRLLALLNAGFLEEEQCIFLSALRRIVPVKRLNFPDRTSYECHVNHIHIEEYLENGGLPPLELLGCGIALARELKARLLALYARRNFRIIVALRGASCTVRFHTVRSEQEWVDKDQLGDGGDAVAILETHESER